VKQILRGKRREETTRFVAFRSHYLFEASFCTPAKGHEKGGVEQENGRFRRRWWTPVPQFASLYDHTSGAIQSRPDHRIEISPGIMVRSHQTDQPLAVSASTTGRTRGRSSLP
jgi:hypothetical protein